MKTDYYLLKVRKIQHTQNHHSWYEFVEQYSTNGGTEQEVKMANDGDDENGLR